MVGGPLAGRWEGRRAGASIGSVQDEFTFGAAKYQLWRLGHVGRQRLPLSGLFGQVPQGLSGEKIKSLRPGRLSLPSAPSLFFPVTVAQVEEHRDISESVDPL